MNTTEVLKALAKMGTAQNRKIHARHGVTGKLFGVSYANQGRLKKQIKTDHELAVRLWGSGNHDARMPATMIADPAQVDSKLLDRWAKDLDNYVITDAFVSYAGKTSLAKKKMGTWTKSKRERTGQSGYGLPAAMALCDDTLSDEYLENRLRLIESEIHSRKNRARHSMNGAVIAIGLRNKRLQKKALAAARRIGKVDVDHGETGCMAPEAISCIKKVAARKTPTRWRC